MEFSHVIENHQNVTESGIESHLGWVPYVLISVAQMYCQRESHLVWHVCSTWVYVCVEHPSQAAKPCRFVCSFFRHSILRNLRLLIVVSVWRMLKLLLQSIVLKSLFWFHDAIIRVATSCNVFRGTTERVKRKNKKRTCTTIWLDVYSVPSLLCILEAFIKLCTFSAFKMSVAEPQPFILWC